MELKFKGFDQITAWVGGIALSAIVFTVIWYTAKNIAKNIDASDSQRLEQVEKDVAKVSAANRDAILKKSEERLNAAEAKSTEYLAPGKGTGTLESWGYEGSSAPWYWATLNDKWSNCGNKHNQSPIDISGARIDETLKSLKPIYKHGVTNLTLHHNTVQGDIEHGSYLDWDGERFDLTRVLFRTPSEHRVNSLPWEMEIQLEHKSLTNHIIMLSVLLTHGKSSTVVDRIAQNLPRYKDETIDYDRLNWIDLLPTKKTYWKYVGTSTVPPCEPNVTWIIMTEPVTATKLAIDKFVILQKTNVRPVYSIGKRELGRSNR